MSGNPNKENVPSKELEKLLSEVVPKESSNDGQAEEPEKEADTTQKIDVLNLPPRKEVHGGKAKRMKIKVTKPYFRLIIVVFLIIILFAGGFYLWGEDLVNLIQHN
ncbi:MAG TPA: hypothetical protein VK142_06850 [Bacillota bacterium]|nr:hypothetical protein [Bacillota bacterium]